MFSHTRVGMMVLAVVSLITLGVRQSWGDPRLSHLESVMDTTGGQRSQPVPRLSSNASQPGHVRSLGEVEGQTSWRLQEVRSSNATGASHEAEKARIPKPDDKLRSYHRASLKTRSPRKGSRNAELKRRRHKRWLKARHKDALSNSSAWNSSNASISISEEIRGIVESTLLASSSSPEEDLVGRRLMNTRMLIGIFDRSIVLIQYVAASLAAVAPCCVLGFMHPGFGSSRNPKLPPSWGPELESNYPFAHWSRDVLLWSIMSEWDGGRKAAALLSVLTGNARELARTIPPAVILNGGVINGQAVDSVTFIMHSLAQRYARLGEEQRLEAIQGLLSFDRHSGERIDALLQRFDGARIKAQEHGNLVLSPQGLSWLLLRAVGVSEHQLLNLLATPPLNGNLPADDQGMEALKSALRRMGHFVERTPGNVASSMNRPNQRFNLAQSPDQFQDMSWSNSEHYPAMPANDASSSYQPPPYPYDTPAAYYADGDSCTDSDTSSNTSPVHEEDMPEEFARPESETHRLWWAYSRAKQAWRSRMNKPTRRARRFLKRGGKGKKGGKGKGKAKIQSTSQNAGAYLASLSDHEVASMFPMAKGRNWRKSSGKGKGRRGNPRGKNGEVMKCHQCGSTEHLVNKCPQRSQSNTTLFIETHAPLSSQAAHDLPPGIISGTFLMVEEADPLQQNDPWSSQPYPMPTSYGPTRSHSYQGHMPQMPQMPSFQPSAPSVMSWQAPSTTTSWTIPATPMSAHNPLAPNTTFRPFPLRPQSNSPASSQQNDALPQQPADAGFLPQEVQPDRQQADRRDTPVPSVPLWANTPEFQFVLGSTPMPPPEFVHPIQQNVVSSLDRYQSQIISDIHDTSLLLNMEPSQRPQGEESIVSVDRKQAVSLQPFQVVGQTMNALELERRQKERRDLESRVRAALRTVEPQPAHEIPVPSATSRETSNHSRFDGFDGPVDTCTICQEEFANAEPLVRLCCRHLFHETCWTELLVREEQPECPTCRGAGNVIANFRYVSVDAQHTPRHRDSPEEETFGTPEQQAWPWWLDASEGVYHAQTQLAGGSSIIVDPGAYTNLCGRKWATRQAEAAREYGHRSYQSDMPNPMVIRGVGNGTQGCTKSTNVPVAVPRVIRPQDGSDRPLAPGAGEAVRFSFEAPVVDGPGEDLPALLGLRSESDSFDRVSECTS